MITSTSAAQSGFLIYGVTRWQFVLHVVSGTQPTFTVSELGDLQVIDPPTLVIDGAAQVSRTMSLTVAASNADRLGGHYGVTAGENGTVGLPSTPDGMERLLNYCGHVKVYAWTVNPNTSAAIRVQVANMPITTYDFDYGPGTVTLELEDWTAVVGRATLPTLWAPVSGTTPLQVGQAVDALIAGAFPTGMLTTVLGNIDPSVGDTTPTKAGLSFTGSRLDAIESLLLPARKILYCKETGVFAARPAAHLGNPGSVNPTLWVGESGGSGDLLPAVVDYQSAPLDNGGYNAVTIAWSSSDGATFGTVFKVHQTGGPEGPGYDSPFGRRVRPTETVDSVNTEAEAIAVADARLAEALRRNRGATVTIAGFPLLLPDDYIEVRLPRFDPGGPVTTETHEIASVSHDTESGLTTLETTVTGYTYL